MTRNFSYGWGTFVLLLASGVALSAEHTKDSPADVQKAVQAKKAVLLDVREQSEWDEGHLKGAKLLPLSKLKKGDPKNITKDLPKDKVIYCHCRAGTRSLQAADILQKLGYDVRPLKEGYEDLLKAGFTKSDK